MTAGCRSQSEPRRISLPPLSGRLIIAIRLFRVESMSAFWLQRTGCQDRSARRTSEPNNSFGCCGIQVSQDRGASAMLRRFFFIGIFFAAVALAANAPWDKPSDRWTPSDVFRILRDSPWSPARFAIESDYTQGRTDPQTGVATDSPSHVQGAVVRGIVVSRGHPLPAVTVLWWSSRTVRLAE